jgi:hypothetical protein
MIEQISIFYTSVGPRWLLCLDVFAFEFRIAFWTEMSRFTYCSSEKWLETPESVDSSGPVPIVQQRAIGKS